MGEEKSFFAQVMERQKREALEIRERRRLAEEEANRPPKKAGRPKGSKNKNPLDNLNLRQTLYVQNKLKGQSDYQSAIQAGYAPATALNAGRDIEGPEVRRVLQQLLRKQVPLEKIAQRAAEMLDANKKTYSTLDGKFTDERTDPDYVERRRGLELFAQMADYWNPKIQHEVENTLSEETGQALLRLAQVLNFHSLSPEQLAELRKSHVPLETSNFGMRIIDMPKEPAQPHQETNLTKEEAISQFVPPEDRKQE